MTDGDGKVSAIIPTLSGLTQEDMNYPADYYDCSLVAGSYLCAAVVKDIGTLIYNAKNVPDWSMMLNPVTVLYESDLMSFSIS